MFATYHKSVLNPPKKGDIPVSVFKLDDKFVQEYQLHGKLCAVTANGYYTFLHLDNGDRIDIAHK